MSYKRHQFPPSIIAHAVWLYVRFNLSLSEADEMLFEGGIAVYYETAPRCTAQFGPQIARNLRQHERCTGDTGHLDEAVVLFVSIHSAIRKVSPFQLFDTLPRPFATTGWQFSARGRPPPTLPEACINDADHRPPWINVTTHYCCNRPNPAARQ